jgi:hypothetical protein
LPIDVLKGRGRIAPGAIGPSRDDLLSLLEDLSCKSPALKGIEPPDREVVLAVLQEHRLVGIFKYGE